MFKGDGRLKLKTPNFAAIRREERRNTSEEMLLTNGLWGMSLREQETKAVIG